MEEDFSLPPKEARRRPSSINVEHLLLAGPNSPKRPPPAERLPGSPTTRTSLESVQTTTSTLSHSRSISLADSVRQSKRLSLSFPIQPPNGRSSRPPSWANSPIKSPDDITSPTENNFLTVLAAQERRVFELKEELRQAEQELDKLKKHYSIHEATRKRGDVRRLQQLQPLSASFSNLDTTEEDVDGSSQWLQKEMERRKTLLNGMKTSNRKVFSGSRHTRTLSLLSPEKSTFSQPFPQPVDIQPEELPSHTQTLIRSSTTPDISTALVRANDTTIPQLDGALPKDALLRTGKQMAADIKDGLMTFFEDIRQATVGDEATTARTPLTRSTSMRQPSRASTVSAGSTRRPAQPRRVPSTVSTHKDGNHDTLIDIGGSFWREQGVESPEAKRILKKGKYNTPINEDLSRSPGDDDPWDNWGTPIKKAPTARSNSSDGSLDSDAPSDAQSTPLTSAGGRDSPLHSADKTLTPHSFNRMSGASDGKRDSIPWPNLDRLTPTNLKRTASHLMREWEKSLTPPAGEHDSDSGLDYPLPMQSQGKVKKAD